jgi:hypothetical protein
MSKNDPESSSEDDKREQHQQQPQLSRTEAVRRMLNQQQEGGVEESSTTTSAATTTEDRNRRDLTINVVAAGLLAACGVASAQLFTTSIYTPAGFRRLPATQFIAALGDPTASEGRIAIAEPWGLWRADPGPRGVYLRDFDRAFSSAADESHSVAPAGWTWDANDWWLEEHGILMEQPQFPLPPGRYLVTGGRSVTTGLTIVAGGGGGGIRYHWKLDEGTLYDVTHLPCRSARYRPLLTKDGAAVTAGAKPLSPKSSANLRDFPVAPGAEMPAIQGHSKQDYAVLFLVGKAITPPTTPI